MNRALLFLVAAALLLGLPARGAAQSCNYGEPASADPLNPRTIDGSNGQHVVLMDCYAATDTSFIGGVYVGNVTYFAITPDVTGTMIVSTCHPNTLFDTVVGLYDTAGGELTYSDDAYWPDCSAHCTGYTSQLSYNVTAGYRYFIRVGSYNNNPQGCALCLGLIVSVGYPCGDPPRNFICQFPRELSGLPGTQHALVDTTDLSLSHARWPCQPATTQVVWFTIQPLVYGDLTVSTCNVGTNYDTVLRLLTGECGGYMTQLECVDYSDCPRDPAAAQFTRRVRAYDGYYLAVGAYDGSGDCLDLEVTLTDRCEYDTQSPTADLYVADFACVPFGQPFELTGAASDPEDNLNRWWIAERAINSPTWDFIADGYNPVAGQFCHWTPATAGYRIVQLTVEDGCGHSATAAHLVYVDTGPSAHLNWPTTGQNVTGRVCIDGYVGHGVCGVSYSVDYRLLGTIPWTPVEGVVSYPGPVANLTLAHWDTLNPPVPEGTYELRVYAFSPGGASEDIVTVDVDNTAPTAFIAEPENCLAVNNVVQIYGSAYDTHFTHWYLDFTGGAIHTWVPIAEGTNPVNYDYLADWDTTGLPACSYALRLRVYEPTVECIVGARYSEYLTTVRIGEPGQTADLDGDGDVDIDDFALFALWYTGPLW